MGKVRAYRRGSVWYLCYYESGSRRRPRVSRDSRFRPGAGRPTDAQREVSAPTAPSFEPIPLVDRLARPGLRKHPFDVLPLQLLLQCDTNDTARAEGSEDAPMAVHVGKGIHAGLPTFELNRFTPAEKTSSEHSGPGKGGA
jgi:hypothetical protein